MRTDRLKKIILEIVQERRGGLVPRGELYQYAQIKGYDGSQERLLNCANLIVSEGKILSQKAGIAHLIQYKSIEGRAI